MTTFTRTWNSGYLAQPADTEVVSQGALRIRNLKSDIQERLEVDHSHAGDVDDGEHKKVTFTAPLGADPSTVAGKAFLYPKDANGKIELFWRDEDGNIIQLTSAGTLAGLVGEIKMWSTASAPTNWISCDGSAISRTTYSDLFAVIGTTFGVGDGSTTFNLPDFRGRSPVGVGTGDAADATAWALAEKGGAETHALTVAELAAHTHNYTRFNSKNSTPGGGTDEIWRAESTQATSSTGSGNAHNNMPPVLGIHFIIYAGA